jgi:hypothetical protein
VPARCVIKGGEGLLGTAGSFTMVILRRVVPNENWQLILDFGPDGMRLFDAEIARKEMGWSQFAYPNRFKNLTYTDESVRWGEGETLSATWLHAKSRPVPANGLEHEVLRLGYKNQAPTPQHRSHHVYGVYLAPFSARPFRIGQSIGGGHAETGDGRDLSLRGLLEWEEWKRHFDLSGCQWAIQFIEAGANAEQLLIDTLVNEICRRSGTS